MSAVIYEIGGKVIISAGFLLGSGTNAASTNQIKFYPQYDYAYSYATGQITLATAQAHLNIIATQQLAKQGYAFTCSWHDLEPGGTNYNNPANITQQYSGFATYIQAICNAAWETLGAVPIDIRVQGASFGQSVSASQLTSTNWGSGYYLNADLVNAGGSGNSTITEPNTYGSTSTTTYNIAPIYPGSAYHGLWFYPGGGSTYGNIAPNWCNGGVTSRFAQLFEAMAQFSWTMPTSGSTPTTVNGKPFAGQTFTVESNPLIARIGINDEYVYDLTQNATGANNNTPPYVGSADECTAANLQSQRQILVNRARAAFPTTPFVDCFSYSFSGNTDETSTQVVARAATFAQIQGWTMSSADVYGWDFQQSANYANTVKQALIGITGPNIGAQGAPLPTPTGTSYVGEVGVALQVQPTDYNKNGPGGDNATAVIAMMGLPQSKLQAHAQVWSVQDATFNMVWASGSNSGYIASALAANRATYPLSSLLPVNYMCAPQNVVASAITATGFTLTWNTLVANWLGTGLTFQAYSGGTLIGTSSGETQSIVVTGLTAGTTYPVQVCMTNSNGSGPLSTSVNVTTTSSLLVLTGALAATQAFPLVQALQVGGGASPYTWTLVSQTGGNGATLSTTGLLTVGAPVATGSITVSATDANSLTTGNVTLALNVTAVTGALTINTGATLPAATNGSGYFYKVSVSGGTFPYAAYVGSAYSATAAGYTGTSGTVWLIQAAADSLYLQAAVTGSGTDSVPFTVVDSAGTSASQTFSIAINSTLAMTGLSKDQSTGTFPTGYVGAAYAAGGYGPTAIAAGGTAPYTYALMSGGPTGLTLVNGTWHGTPTAAGNYSPVIKVTDNVGATATATYAMSIVPSQTVALPAWNAALATPCFFQQSGQFYDPGGVPFRPRGLNRNHYDNSGDAAAFVAARASAVRYVLYYGATDATQASDMQSQHLNNDQYAIASRFATTGGTLTSGSNSLSVLGNCIDQWVTNTASWFPLQGLMGLNIANEWGNANSSSWSQAYAAVNAPITGMTTTTLTFSGTTPFNSNNVGLGYVWISGGGVTAQLCPVTASGSNTLTGTFPSGYTSGGTVYGGAIGILRACGYNCPLHIDSGGSGQDKFNFLNYAGAVQASDPISNCVFGYHLYGYSTNIACPITAITTGSSTAVHYTGPAWMAAGGNYNPFYTFNYNGDFQGSAVVYGAGGVSGLNGNTGTLSGQGGAQPAWNATVGVASSGTYTSGGYVLDSYHYMLVISNLAALQSQGVCILLEELGPALPPLYQGAGSNTLVTSGQVIRTCEANGLGWLAWAMDDGASGPAINNGYTACLYVGVYTGAASQLSYSGLEVIANPVYGVTVASTMASFNV